jgi:hypothetical protein
MNPVMKNLIKNHMPESVSFGAHGGKVHLLFDILVH